MRKTVILILIKSTITFVSRRCKINYYETRFLNLALFLIDFLLL